MSHWTLSITCEGQIGRLNARAQHLPSAPESIDEVQHLSPRLRDGLVGQTNTLFDVLDDRNDDPIF